MYKAVAVFLLLFIIPIMIYAQDSDPDVDDWEDYYSDHLMRGDQSITISIGPVLPTFFIHNGIERKMNFSPAVGGSGHISYNYFLNSNLFIGGEIGVQFINSINGDSLFFIPLGARTGYQFKIWRLDIPISLSVGMCWQRFLSSGYYGMYGKAALGAYYSITSGWAFGLSSGWYWFPQWTNDSSKNMHGNMLDITLSARYSF